MADRNAQIILSLKDQISAGVKTTTQAFIGLTDAEQKAEQQTLRMAQAYARLDAAQKNPAAGAQRLRDALSNATVVTQQHGVAIQAQIAQLDNQAARMASGASLAQQFGSSFKSSLLGIVGPAALVTGAFTVAQGAIASFADAFKFKAQLDETTQSMAIQLRGVRDSTQVFASAAQFAEKYKFTQQETNDALRGSVSILRSSTSSAEDLLGVLARLQVLSPEQGLAGASLALKELSGGSTTSLVTRFEVSRTAANKMKNEIADGADAVSVMAKYLDDAGVSMETLENRATGAAGAMREQVRAQEELKKAQAEFAQGPGIAITRIQTVGTRQLASDFGDGGGGLAAANQAFLSTLMQTGSVLDALDARVKVLSDSMTKNAQETIYAASAYNANVAAARDAADTSSRYVAILSEETQKKIDSQIASAALAAEQKALERDSIAAANGMLGAGDQALLLAQKYGIAIGQAQALINAQQQLTNAQGLADQRKGEQTGTTLSADQFNDFSNIQREYAQRRAREEKQAAEKAAADAKRLQDLQNQNRLINAKTTADKIRELEKQKAATTDPIERQQLQNQIDQERLSAAKSHTGELGKQLGLQERIYDSVNKQRDALLDIEELTIRDRQQDREDAKNRRIAERILNSPLASADMKARATDALALIDVQDRKRAAEIADKQSTVSGSIVNGRILQSQPGSGPVTVPRPGGGAPGAVPTPVSSTPGGGAGAFTVIVQIDGREAWKGIAPFAWNELLQEVRARSVAG